jgi:hypothetical protein
MSRMRRTRIRRGPLARRFEYLVLVYRTQLLDEHRRAMPPWAS